MYPIILIASMLILSSCQMMPEHENSKNNLKSASLEKNSQKARDKANKIKEKKPAYPHYNLSGSLLYDFLIAGIAFDNADFELAYSTYKQLMEKTSDPRIAKLIIRAALASKNDEYMLHAANLWEKIEPGNKHIQQIKAMVLIKLGRDQQASKSLIKLVEFADNHQAGFKKVEVFLSSIKPIIVQNKLPKEKKVLSAKKRLAYFFEQLETKFPDNFYLNIVWSKFASQFKEAVIALDKIDKALLLQPKNTTALLIKLEVLNKFQSKKNLEPIYLKAIENAENSSLIRLQYAKHLLSKKKNKQAIEQLDKMTRSSGVNQQVLYEIGLLSLDVKEYAAAEKFFKKYYEFSDKASSKMTLTQKSPITAQRSKKKMEEHVAGQIENKNKAAYTLGKLFFEHKDKLKALNWFEKVAKGLYFYQAVLHRVLIQADQNHFDSALELLASLSPQTEERKRSVLRLKADILFQSKSIEKAYKAYTEALVVHSYSANKDEYTELLYNRAMAAEKLNKISQMEQDLLTILKEEPKNSDVLNTLGFLLTEKTTRYKEAQQYIEKALKIVPNDMAVIDSMGWVLYKQGDLKKSVEYLKKAYLVDKDPEISAHYGEVLWFLEQKKLAQEVWKKALAKDPKHVILNKTIKRFLSNN